jgi:1-acyl-sn-glycerol-3-phosphate acyltransferase
VRVPLRLAAMVWTTCACYLALAGGRLLLFRDRRRADAWALAVFRRWARWLGRIAGMRVEIDGAPPSAPFLLVANHLSYVDILLLGGASGGVFVAKREIASWPVLGHLCRAVGTVFIDRGAKRDLVRAAEQVEDALADGRGVILFPEATTGDGTGLLAFRSSMLQSAAADGQPVHWAVLRYATPPTERPASRAVCWTGGAALVPHALALLAMPRFTARLSFGAEPVADGDRKRLAELLRGSMEARRAELAAELDGPDEAG